MFLQSSWTNVKRLLLLHTPLGVLMLTWSSTMQSKKDITWTAISFWAFMTTVSKPVGPHD